MSTTRSWILIVDDTPTIRDGFARILRADGYNVLTAGDGRQALAVVDRVAFDLLVIDLLMPVMDGWELARELQARGCQVPLIVMTDDRHGAALAHDIGAVAFLPKPFAIPALLTTVDAVIYQTVGRTERLVQRNPLSNGLRVPLAHR